MYLSWQRRDCTVNRQPVTGSQALNGGRVSAVRNFPATLKHGIWIAVATQAGRTVDEDFPGGGYVFAPDGRQVYTTPDWFPGVAYLSLDLKEYSVVPL